MANYKPYGHNFLSVGGYIYNLKGDETPITLHMAVLASVAGVSMHTIADANYTVPTGKKLKPISCLSYGGQNARTLRLEQSDTADSSTNPKDIARWLPQVSGVGFLQSEIAFIEGQTVAEGKYLNCTCSVAIGQGYIGELYGVEIET